MSDESEAPKGPSFQAAIPVLRVGSSVAAEKFYCGRLGFRKEFAHYLEQAKPDPCYFGVSRDGVRLHLSSFSEDGVPGGVVHLSVDDVDAVNAELLSKGVAIDSGPMDQTWGARELYVKDADGNTIRFVQHRRG